VTASVDIAFVSPSEVNLASASFVFSSTAAQVWVKSLHAIPVRTRRSATGDGLRLPLSSCGRRSSGTDRREKDPLAKSVPGLVQQAH
jgi:hypothetical protein